MQLYFDAGSLLLSGNDLSRTQPPAIDMVYDSRVDAWRAPAYSYANTVHQLSTYTTFTDKVFSTKPLIIPKALKLTLRDYQQQAIDCWQANNKQGLVILPTGVGKSIVGIEAIRCCGCSALIVLPTIDLMVQWASQLEQYFQQPIGMYGGGSKTLQSITVITYDSAVIMMEFIGDKFPLIIFDECHHLPGAVNRLAAELSPAPFRLGLSATPERNDAGEHLLYQLIGPEVYRREIQDFDNAVLADYETHIIDVPMTNEERDIYQQNRQIAPPASLPHECRLV